MKTLILLTLLFTELVSMGQIKPTFSLGSITHVYNYVIYDHDKQVAYKDSCGWTIVDPDRALDAIIKANHTSDSVYRAQIKAVNELLSTTQYNSISGMFVPYSMRKKHFKALVNYWKVTGQLEGIKKEYYKIKKQKLIKHLI